MLGLLAIPIIALYVLRQRRPDTPISSTLLWNKALSDMRASTPWQKLRRNLLLILQLLILAALVLTLMRPVMHAQAKQTTAGVIVLDATASMLATDNGGPSRFDRAKEQVRELINTMRPGDRFNIIVDGGGMAQSSSGFLNSKGELRSFVDGLKASHASSDLSESLLLAATSLRAIGTNLGDATKTEALKAGKIYLLSDGAGVALPGVYQDIHLEFIKIGESSKNVGITRLAVTRVPKQDRVYEIFVGLLNSATTEQKVTVGLALGKQDNLVSAQRTVLGAGMQGGVTFEKVLAEPGKFFVQLEAKDDDLAIDNIAYGLIERPRKVNVVLVTAGNQPIEDFLKTAAALGEIDGRIVSAGSYKADIKADLVIFDGVVPKELPRGDMFFIRPTSSVGGFKIVGSLERPGILRTKTDAGVLDSVELSGVRILKAGQLERDGENVELISAAAGPLMAYRDVAESRRYILTFSPLTESNWWRYGPSLVIMLENMIGETRRRHFIGAPQIIAAGSPARLFDLAAGATVTLPNGVVRGLDKYIRDGVADFTETDEIGFYTVRSGERTGAFAVNVLSQRESDITPRALEVPAGGNVDETRSVAMVNREIWQWLAVAGLVVLLLEWIVYHRRIA